MKTAPNQRNTKQRRVILEELEMVKTHPTASELYELVRKRLPRISLGTVYRNLEQMAVVGKIQKLEGGREARFDAELHDHTHVRCIECGRMDDLEDQLTVNIDSAAINQDGWEIKDHRIEFLGRCPSCRNGSGGRQEPVH